MGMSLIVLLGIAFGLAMDAFATSIACGVMLCGVSHRQAFRLSFHFGLFQFMMPFIGWLAGRTIVDHIEAYDHWVAFGLLAFIGGKMIHEALKKPEERANASDPTTGLSLVSLSIATSIDALAVGFVFAAQRVSILFPCIVIGVVAFVMTALGMRLGCLFGSRFGHRMEAIGGVVLVAIGFKILFDHLFPSLPF